MILLPPPPPIERERTYHWIDRTTDLDMTEVERLTWRVGEDGKTVRERRLVRTEMDGVKVPTPDTIKPEILAVGEKSKDELTARIDRIAALPAPTDGWSRERSLSEAPPLPSAEVRFLVKGSFLTLTYIEPSEWRLDGPVEFSKDGRMASFKLMGDRIPLPGGESVAQLTVSETPIAPSPLGGGLGWGRPRESSLWTPSPCPLPRGEGSARC
ncbi:hypothetical protein BH11ARM2_BH11ARM2_01360 [soil metagenome]